MISVPISAVLHVLSHCLPELLEDAAVNGNNIPAVKKGQERRSHAFLQDLSSA